MSDQVHLMCDKLQYSWGGGGCCCFSRYYSLTFFVLLVLSDQQRSQDAPNATSHSRASDSGGETRRTPPSNVDNGPQPPSSKPGWAEEGGSGWVSQGAPSAYQVLC